MRIVIRNYNKSEITNRNYCESLLGKEICLTLLIIFFFEGE